MWEVVDSNDVFHSSGRIIRAYSADVLGKKMDVAEVYLSKLIDTSVRAWKKNENLDICLRIIQGQVIIGLKDSLASATQFFRASSEQQQIFYIPSGVIYGFQATDESGGLVLCSASKTNNDKFQTQIDWESDPNSRLYWPEGEF